MNFECFGKKKIFDPSACEIYHTEIMQTGIAEIMTNIQSI